MNESQFVIRACIACERTGILLTLQTSSVVVFVSENVSLVGFKVEEVS
jgi:hypothetical protein